MRISDWSSDVCSSDLHGPVVGTLMSNFGFERALGEAGIGFIRAKGGDRHAHKALVEDRNKPRGEAPGHPLRLGRATHGDGLVSAPPVLDVRPPSRMGPRAGAREAGKERGGVKVGKCSCN